MLKRVAPPSTASTQKHARIFSVGATLPSGRIADDQFIDAVVNNWNNKQAKGDPRFPQPTAYLIPAPSITVGHEELSSIAKHYAERTDLPALGWPSELRRDGNYLMARFERVPAKLAEWIEAGAYADVSAEFYEDFEGHGPCLRRVSILGASIPDRKDLGKIPEFYFDSETENETNPLAFVARHAERGKEYALVFAGGHCVKFAETIKGNTMTPQQQQLVAALQAAGVDCTPLDGQKLDSIMAAMTAKSTEGDPNDPPVPPAKNAEDEDPDKDEEGMAAKFAELAKPLVAQIATLQKELTGVRDNQKTHFAQRDREAIAAFCEKHKDRIFPSEMNPVDGSPSLVDQLLGLDDTAVVAKFSEGGQQVGLSQRALMMRNIAKRPVVARFAEKVPNPIPDAQQKDEVTRLLAMTKDGQAVLRNRKA